MSMSMVRDLSPVEAILLASAICVIVFIVLDILDDFDAQ